MELSPVGGLGTTTITTTTITTTTITTNKMISRGFVCPRGVWVHEGEGIFVVGFEGDPSSLVVHRGQAIGVKLIIRDMLLDS